MKLIIENNVVPLVILGIMYAFVLRKKDFSNSNRKLFTLTLGLFVLCLFFRNADYITSNYEVFTGRRKFYSAMGYFLRAMTFYGMIGVDLDLGKPGARGNYLLLGIPAFLTFFSAFSVFFTNAVYGFTVSSNNFKQGPLAILNSLALIFYMLVLAVKVFADFKKGLKRHATMLIAMLIILITTMLVEYFGLREFLSESLIALAMLLYLMFSQNEGFIDEQRKLESKSRTDALTQLYNRSFYDYLTEKMLGDSDSGIAVLVLDIDLFKNINDTYGHETGDRILKEVAKLLKVTFRSSDYVIRYGGDEFVVLMTGVSRDIDTIIKNKVDSINVHLQNPISDLPKTSVSAGLAFSEEGYSEHLFKNADRALYHTKETTRCGCTVYEEEFEKI